MILAEGGHLTNTDVERADTVFASIFNDIDRPWTAQFFDLEDHVCQYNPFADPEIVRNQLYQLGVHKSMDPDGIHAGVLKELLDVAKGPLSKLLYILGGSEGRPNKL